MIPQELVDNIVREVGSIDDRIARSTLQACALTSWSFLAPARRILFEKIYLQEDSALDEGSHSEGKSKLERLLDLFQHNPSLEANVTSLVLQLSSAQNRRADEDSVQNARTAILPSILDSLFHVDSFSLVFNFSVRGSRNYRWDNVDTPLQETLIRFCSSRPITQLKIGMVQDLPINLITNCPTLSSLSLAEVFLATNASDSFPPPLQTVAKLTSLTLANRPTSLIFPQLTRHGQNSNSNVYFDLSNLHTLIIRTEVLLDLKLDVPSVTHLRILCWHYFDLLEFNGYFEFPLTGWRNLQALEFDCRFTRGRGIRDLPLISPAGFGTINSSSPLSIHTLKIVSRWYHRTRANEMEPFRPSDGWNGIDSVLTSPAFSNLRTIKLDLTLQYILDSSLDRTAIQSGLLPSIQERLPELFPSVFAKKSIQVELEVTPIVPVLGMQRFSST